MSYFIWTEVYNCGKIGNIALKYFNKYHPNLKVHVYGTKKDFEDIEKYSNVESIVLEDSFVKDILDKVGVPNLTTKRVQNGFKKGHLGTARLWAYLIKTRKEKFMIHFDSDVIFRSNLLDEIIEKTKICDIVGPYRLYKNNPNNREDMRKFADVSQTSCFAFNREKISNHFYSLFIKMCQGAYNPLGHPVIDFFDPVMFDILKNGGIICHLDFDDVGAWDKNGSRDNKYKEINNYDTPFKLDFGNKMIHFSAVGSGMNIFNNNKVNMPESYRQYALDRFALFCKIFYDEDIGIDLSTYNNLIEAFKKEVVL